MKALIKDRDSLEWVQVRDHCTRRLAELRDENEGDLDPAETTKIRGMIEMAREIIALGEDEPTVQIVEPNYID